EPTWTDRLGRERKSWRGMENDFSDFLANSGYQLIGDYAPDIEITAYNQIVRDDDGEFWRLAGQTELPYVTTGAGLPEGGAFVAVGDAALRQELASPAGAAMVGRGAMTVGSIADLVALPEGLGKADLSYSVTGYHHCTAVGGGTFVWDASRPKADHNGGTVIDPAKTFPADWSNLDNVRGWFTPASLGSGCFVRSEISGSTLTPECFGAVGDGVAIDSYPLIALCSATGRNVRFEQNATYLIDRQIVLADYVSIVGYGATLKRCDGFSTTLTSPITEVGSNTVVCSVISSDDLTVGQTIVFYKPAGGHFPYNVQITDISGNQLTVAKHSSFVVGDYTTGDSIARSFKMVNMSDRCIVENLVFDGNRGANTAIAKWQNHNALVGWSNTVIRNCHIKNEIGEGIIQYLDNGIIEGNLIENCGGNGIHFSGSNNIKVDRCTIKNTNLTSGVGHEDGNLCWSNLCQNITISNCFLENGKSAFGSIDYDGNSDVTLIGNTIRNQRTTALDMVITGESSAAGNVIIANNRFYNSKALEIKDPAKVQFAKNISITGNIFVDTTIDAVAVNGISINGNVFNSIPGITSPMVRLEDSVFSVVGNAFIGGNIAVLHLHSDGVISDNAIRNPLSFGVVSSSNTLDNKSEVLVSGNVISNTTQSTTLVCILLRHGDICTGNRIEASGVKYGILVSGDDVIATKNKIVVQAGATIRIDAGFDRNIVEDNYISADVNNASLAPGNIVENNRIVIR